jgi:hypothetical protein
LLLVLTGALLLREGADIGVLTDASEVGVLVYCDVWIDLHGFGGLVGVSNVKRVFNLFLLTQFRPEPIKNTNDVQTKNTVLNLRKAF